MKRDIARLVAIAAGAPPSWRWIGTRTGIGATRRPKAAGWRHHARMTRRLAVAVAWIRHDGKRA